MDTDKQSQQAWTSRRVIATLAVSGLLLYMIFWTPPALGRFFSRVGGIAVMLVLAIALAYIVSPAVERLRRISVPLPERTRRSIAAVLVMVALGGLIWLLFVVTSSGISAELEQLPVLYDKASDRLQKLSEEWLATYTEKAPEGVKRFIQESSSIWEESLSEIGGRVFEWVIQAVSGVFFLVELVLVPILAFYFVTDSRRIRASTLGLLPISYRDSVDELIGRLNAIMHKYIRGMLLVCLIMGGLTAAILYGAKVSIFLLLGLLTGLAQLIPIVGSIVVAIPIIGIPWLQNGFTSALIVGILYGLLNLLQANLIMPVVVGREIKLHPVTVIIALLIGAEFAGIMGMLVAVPVAAIAKVTHQWYQDLVEANEEPL